MRAEDSIDRKVKELKQLNYDFDNLNTNGFGKPPRKGAQRDQNNRMIKDTQERTTQQSDSPDAAANYNRIGVNKSPQKPLLFNNKFVRTEAAPTDNQYFSPQPVGNQLNNLRNRAQRRGLLIGGTQTENSPFLNPYANMEQSTPKVLFTVNHVEKKLLGFVDFDLQCKRPDVQASNAHDQRFEPYDHFPPNYTKTQHNRLIKFDQYQARDGRTYQVNMSEPLFDREKHLNLYKRRPQGILQFGTMKAKTQMAQTQNYSTAPQDPMMANLEGHSRKKAIMAILAASNKKNELDNQERIPEIAQRVVAPQLDKMKPRNQQRTDQLPGYMQNNNCRIAMTQNMGRSLIDNHYSQHEFLDPRSTFLARKDFRVDPLQSQKVVAAKGKRNQYANDATGKQKRSLTFNQLLAKYGYIEDESMTKKERVREWHVKKAKVDDSDDSDDDF